MWQIKMILENDEDDMGAIYVSVLPFSIDNRFVPPTLAVRNAIIEVVNSFLGNMAEDMKIKGVIE